MKTVPKTSSRLSSSSRIVGALTLALLVVIGFAYVAVQQSYRLGANDPQIQFASDIAAEMSAGSLPHDAIDTRTVQVDPSKSLDPFAIIVDSNGNATASTMSLEGASAVPPKGVLSASSLTHQNRVTWQPQSGTRIALVVQAYQHDNNSGYVIVGRSLKEVEVREDMLFWMATAAAGVVILLGGFAFLSSRKS